ncbi:hypothetical protein SDC9_158284 [bioreactor metagenome]|uniref:Uncharacterized protein n=1 Tax=bioreactor metagenome TaxID=1076179 RepID=A0A645FBJ3_9ZZZZ
MLAFTLSSKALAFFAFSIVVCPAAQTKITPSAIVDKTAASVTKHAGGESKSTISYTFFNSSSNIFILFDPRSSEGLGGIGPDDNMSKFST